MEPRKNAADKDVFGPRIGGKDQTERGIGSGVQDAKAAGRQSGKAGMLLRTFCCMPDRSAANPPAHVIEFELKIAGSRIERCMSDGARVWFEPAWHDRFFRRLSGLCNCVFSGLCFFDWDLAMRLAFRVSLANAFAA